MAAVWTGRGLAEARADGRRPRVLLLDGSVKVGIKILVAGGGRCNVTHHEVDEKQYAGGSRNTIRKVLRSFNVPRTVEFFRELGVDLKQEDTGKLFPVTDRAQTVLEALLSETRRLDIELVHPWRVGEIDRGPGGGFLIRRDNSTDTIETPRVVLATGGKALPKSGSDGGGYTLATSLGHTLTTRMIPALVPLVIGGQSHWMTELSGISARVSVEVRAGSGKRIARFENDMLCTHFGLSGPAVMDASRWLIEAKANDPAASLHVGWLLGETFESVEESLLNLGEQRLLTWLRDRLPERLAKALCERLGVDPAFTGSTLTKEARRALAHALVGMPVEVLDDRGFTHAEATAGGVPLSEIDPGSMRSRACEGLWLIGEILDVDGRIGGFNFQWAWSSGHAAGRSLARDTLASIQPDESAP